MLDIKPLIGSPEPGIAWFIICPNPLPNELPIPPNRLPNMPPGGFIGATPGPPSGPPVLGLNP